MNLVARLSIASAMLISSTSYAVEPDDGWYAGLMIGGSYLNKIDLELPITYPLAQLGLLAVFTHDNNTQISYNIGINGGFQFGYRWCDNFRFEGQLYTNYNVINRLKFPGLPPIKQHRDE